jgi:pyruvate kinase
LVWGVSPLVVAEQADDDGTFAVAMDVARSMGMLRSGDLVVETAGTLSGVSGSTDLIKVGIVA